MDTPIKTQPVKGSDNPFLMDNKKKKGGKGKLIVILVLIVLIAAAVVAVMMNLFGLKDKIIHAIVSQETQYTEAYAQLDTAQKELSIKQGELKAAQDELAEAQAALQKREDALDKREEDLEAQQAGAAGSGVTSGSGEGVQTEDGYTQLAQIYQSMDAANAAARLGAIKDNEQVAKLLSHMKTKNAGAILEKMTSESAAAVSRIMMQDPQAATPAPTTPAE